VHPGTGVVRAYMGCGSSTEAVGANKQPGAKMVRALVASPCRAALHIPLLASADTDTQSKLADLHPRGSCGGGGGAAAAAQLPSGVTARRGGSCGPVFRSVQTTCRFRHPAFNYWPSRSIACGFHHPRASSSSVAMASVRRRLTGRLGAFTGSKGRPHSSGLRAQVRRTGESH
jgi:hypothetical protein